MEEMFHYYLVAGQVTFLAPQEDGTKEVRTAMVNTLAPLSENKITLKTLGVIQQQLQRVLFTRLGEPEEVIDVVITHTSYMGHMTKIEFDPSQEATKEG